MTTLPDPVEPSDASASEAADALLAVGHAGTVLLLEPAGGRIVWERSLAAIAGAPACEGQPVSVDIIGNSVLAGCMGHVVALKIDDGSLLWHVDKRGRGDGATSLALGFPAEDFVSSLGSAD
jgi:hypothetical protein